MTDKIISTYIPTSQTSNNQKAQFGGKFLEKANSTSTAGNYHKYIPEDYKKIARSMESQFAEQMIKQMKKAISKEGSPSAAENFYSSLLTTEQAKAMSTKGEGIGIQELILNEIYPKKFRNKANYDYYKKQANKYLRNKIAKAGLNNIKNNTIQKINAPTKTPTSPRINNEKGLILKESGNE